MALELKFGVLLVLLSATTAVCAQRYQGCVTKGGGKIDLAGHGPGITNLILNAPTWCMDLTVDDAQNVMFHDFTMEFVDRVEISQNVYFDLVATNVVSETLDLNPILIDNEYTVKPYPNTPLQVSGTYFNRNFENEFSGILHPIGGAFGLKLDYSEYPEKLRFERDGYYQLNWENRTDIELEPELVLRILQSTVLDLSIELLPVPPAEANGVIGDSNLDGIFNSSDMITVFSAGEYEDDIPLNSTWREGDWNSDLDFNTADLIYAFQNGSYSAAATAGTVVVPEPGKPGLLLGLLWLFRRRKQS